jgi:hypothetical protein
MMKKAAIVVSETKKTGNKLPSLIPAEVDEMSKVLTLKGERFKVLFQKRIMVIDYYTA